MESEMCTDNSHESFNNCTVTVENNHVDQTIVKRKDVCQHNICSCPGRLVDTESQTETLAAVVSPQIDTEIFKLKKELEACNKAKEMTVMRYANSEKEVLKVKRQLENADKQIQLFRKEMENMNKKNVMLSSERERLALMVDSKVGEIQSVQKELDRVKLEVSSQEFKLKWTQSKLITESENHKEAQQKLQVTQQELQKALAENQSVKEKFAAFSTENIIGMDEDGVSSAITDSIEASESNSDETPATSPTESSVYVKEIEAMKKKNTSLVNENNSLSCRVQSLQEERLVIEQKIVRLQESNDQHLHQIAALQSDLAAAESLKNQIKQEKDRIVALQNECAQLKSRHSESLSDMTVCRGKEAELLAYTQQVTEKNVLLQSEFSSVEAKSLILKEENESLRLQIQTIKNEIKEFEKTVAQQNKSFEMEKQVLENGQSKLLMDFKEVQRELDEKRGEIIMLQKKHSQSIRELNRELCMTRRQMKDVGNCEAMSHSSRTSSSSSLNNLDVPIKQKSTEDILMVDRQLDQELPMIPDQQALIERIVKLQGSLAKKQEKIEFLHEHGKQLVEALQKKSKIIQSYAMCQDVGALTSELSEKNKAEVVKHGGVMASVYGSKLADEGLTLELSLEINRKLQTVLEDSLLKNITLKENLNTLGKEISKLTEENRRDGHAPNNAC